ncbi:MAG: hypothetical protein IPO60_09700 [Flavobacteriales bacterium]|nr:hypothetical protein [Flavobacteriales bacterium]
MKKRPSPHYRTGQWSPCGHPHRRQDRLPFRETNAKEFERSIAELKAQGIADAHLQPHRQRGGPVEAKRIVAGGGRSVAASPAGRGWWPAPQPTSKAHLTSSSCRIHGLHDPGRRPRCGQRGRGGQRPERPWATSPRNTARLCQALRKKEDEIESIWSKGEQWYTGEEAVAQGFVDGLVDDYTESVDEETLARMAACGCPKDKLPKQAQHEHNNDRMNIEAMRASLGMPNTATEAEVLARVNELKTANDCHVATAERAADQRGEVHFGQGRGRAQAHRGAPRQLRAEVRRRLRCH